jgi:hypothetical protein
MEMIGRAHASSRQEVGARDCAHDGAVAQHGCQVVAGAGARAAEVPPFAAAHEAHAASRAHRAGVEGRRAPAQARAPHGGYSRLTDFIRAWREGEGQAAQSTAFMPLAFELGEAF